MTRHERKQTFQSLNSRLDRRFEDAAVAPLLNAADVSRNLAAQRPNAPNGLASSSHATTGPWTSKNPRRAGKPSCAAHDLDAIARIRHWRFGRAREDREWDFIGEGIRAGWVVRADGIRNLLCLPRHSRPHTTPRLHHCQTGRCSYPGIHRPTLRTTVRPRCPCQQVAWNWAELRARSPQTTCNRHGLLR